MNMLVNLADLLAAPGREKPFSFEADAAALDVVSPDYSFEGPVRMEGRLLNTGAGIRAEGMVQAVKQFTCDRCLKACTEEQSHPFAEEFHQGREDESDSSFYEGDTLDLLPFLRDVLVASQPIQNLCKPDCKGLCPVCGHDLNEGDCGCDRFVPDPRLAALQQLWKKDERKGDN